MADLCDFCCKLVLYDYSAEDERKTFTRPLRKLTDQADAPGCPFCAVFRETLLAEHLVLLGKPLSFMATSCSEGSVWLEVTDTSEDPICCPWLITYAEVMYESTTIGRSRVDCDQLNNQKHGNEVMNVHMGAQSPQTSTQDLTPWINGFKNVYRIAINCTSPVRGVAL
jgi:hypothetical protein